MDSILTLLHFFDDIFWGYIAFGFILFLGLFLTIKNRFVQLRDLPQITRTFIDFVNSEEEGRRGVHPLKAFFASVGGMIGVGNVCGVVTAVQLGGPGALFWLWIAGVIGSVVKYSEIYLGLKYRVPNAKGGYDGGPMYFLKAAFKTRALPTLVALFLCIYGVEIYQFSVVSDSLSQNWGLNRPLVILGLLGLILFASLGGVNRIGRFCSILMPFFLVTYLLMGLWILFCERLSLPYIFATVFSSAFTGHAAMGGFVGSSMVMAIQHGIARASYSADLGIGYDSIIQSESSATHPERQARLSILGVFIDNIICTFSILIVLVTGLWQTHPQLESSQVVQEALSRYFPGMDIFMPIFISIVGFTTTIAYFTVGIKCAGFLNARFGPKIYIAYGVLAFVIMAFFDQKNALLVMSLSGAMLLFINLLGIFRLRREISFVNLHAQQEVKAPNEESAVGPRL